MERYRHWGNEQKTERPITISINFLDVSANTAEYVYDGINAQIPAVYMV